MTTDARMPLNQWLDSEIRHYEEAQRAQRDPDSYNAAWVAGQLDALKKLRNRLQAPPTYWSFDLSVGNGAIVISKDENPTETAVSLGYRTPDGDELPVASMAVLKHPAVTDGSKAFLAGRLCDPMSDEITHAMEHIIDQSGNSGEQPDQPADKA